ncbi:OsmC family protein [Gracilimonas sp.]|uniref:OsmC family protein n=1 Tax=Gracilimonas sp. TaxID=1974203 RepID=UPI003D0BD058
MMADKHLYDVDLKWEHDRIGTLSSDKLDDNIEVATPPEFPGGIEGTWSPEHLFIASISSCFMTTFAAIAEYSKLDYESLDVPSTGVLAKVEGKYAIKEVYLKPRLVISDEKAKDKAYRILEKAEEACLISRSVKTEIILEPKVTIAVLN